MDSDFFHNQKFSRNEAEESTFFPSFYQKEGDYNLLFYEEGLLPEEELNF